MSLLTPCCACGDTNVSLFATKPYEEGMPIDRGWTCRPCLRKLNAENKIDPEVLRIAGIIDTEAN